MKKLKILSLGCLAGLLVSPAATAQTFRIDWSTIDGGGGTSSGSGWKLTGTIGQPDAGLVSGGGFTLAGGFWAIESLAEEGEIRFTAFDAHPNGTISVEWVGGGTLQASPALGTGAAWQDVAGATSPYRFTPTGRSVFLRVRR